MTESQCILSLFSNVCNGAIFENQIEETEIKKCIENMKKTYIPRDKCLTSSERPSSNYADVAHRCAYLHKYAPFHTVLTCKMLRRAFSEKRYVFEELLELSHGDFFLCSLGGGPGTDVIAVTALIHEYFGLNINVKSSIVDAMPEWGHTFYALQNELKTGNYGHLSYFFGNSLDWRYLGVNLLDMRVQDKALSDGISTADMVTMVKFVSAAACKDTSAMLQKIFHLMKPGALILYIDNDTAKLNNLVMEAAKEVQLETVFGPLKHLRYVNDLFKVKKFGYTACSETTVNVHILQKPFQVIDINSAETNAHGKGVKRKAGCFGKTNIAKRLRVGFKETKQFFKKTREGFSKKISFKNKKPLLSFPPNLSPYQHKGSFYHNVDSFCFKTRYEDSNNNHCEQLYPDENSNNDCKLPYYDNHPIRSPIGWSPDYREQSVLPNQFTPLRSPLSSYNYPSQNIYTPRCGGLNPLSTPSSSNNYPTQNSTCYTPGYGDPNSPFTPFSSSNYPTQNVSSYTPGYRGPNSPFTPLSPLNSNNYSTQNCYTPGERSPDSPRPFYNKFREIIQKKLYF